MVFHLAISSSSNFPILFTKNGHDDTKRQKMSPIFLRFVECSNKFLLNINKLKNIIRFGIENAIN